jgi:hypothetical protein
MLLLLVRIGEKLKTNCSSVLDVYAFVDLVDDHADGRQRIRQLLSSVIHLLAVKCLFIGRFEKRESMPCRRGRYSKQAVPGGLAA